MSAREIHRLSVLLFTDIVASVQLQERLGTQGYARLLSRHDALFRQALVESSGRILKHTGDGFLAEFAMSSEAVAAALRFQRLLHEEPWDPEPVRARVGLHQGEVLIVDPGKDNEAAPLAVGMAVNLAARVMDLAAGSQILITRPVYENARYYLTDHLDPAGEGSELRWAAHGAYTFQGWDDFMDIFEVGFAGIAPFTAPEGGAKSRRASGTPAKLPAPVDLSEIDGNGRQIGTCSHDRTVRLWDFPSGAERHRWTHRLDVDGFDFSPDGKLMASASDDQTVRIWETVSGLESPLSPLQHPLDGDLAKFSPDGHWLATVADNEVRVWRFENFADPPLKFDLENVTAGALSPTGLWAAAGSENGTISQWATENGQVRHPRASHDAPISEVIYSLDGDWLISGDLAGRVMVWEARTGQLVTAPLSHPEAITSLVMPANGVLIVASGSRLQSWSVPGGQRGPQHSLQSTVVIAAVDPAGKYVGAGCESGTTVVCHANTLVPIHTFSSSGSIQTLDFSRDNLMVSGSDDWSARLWNLEDGTQLSRTMGHGGEVTSARFHPLGDRLITGALDQRARLWSTETLSILGNSFTHGSGVLSVAFSPEGLRVATGSADQTARVWDVATSTPLTQGLPHNAGVTHAAFTPGGSRLFTVAPGDGARLWTVSLAAEGQLAPDLFLEVAEAIGGLQLNAANQLIPLHPGKRHMILGKAERETRRMRPTESNAYLQFIRSFIDKHGAELRPEPRAVPRPRPPSPGRRGSGPPRRPEQPRTAPGN